MATATYIGTKSVNLLLAVAVGAQLRSATRLADVSPEVLRLSTSTKDEQPTQALYVSNGASEGMSVHV